MFDFAFDGERVEFFGDVGKRGDRFDAIHFADLFADGFDHWEDADSGLAHHFEHGAIIEFTDDLRAERVEIEPVVE